ncbi:hypothetical protein N8T08_004596 [Aspergillus melleus]|uniref:Uncharacterized protein n=1 Tax=Aspergillus melleus TaxID=138277 RepID=A0ACC3B4Q4_9EURO|nr:hypothetical protein N8T08_004596 [Aspergillus melleus]
MASLPDIPELGLVFPASPIANAAFDYVKKHCDEAVYNHQVRAAYWALIMVPKLPQFVTKPPNMNIVVVACILHDMGLANSPELLSADKRFEVDGANIARNFIENYMQTHGHASDVDECWGEASVQRVWDAIALHATSSIALHAAPEVALTQMGVAADFRGPNYPNGPGQQNLISEDEYHAVMRVFPRAGFTSECFKRILCGVCHRKPATTYDNWVGAFGLQFGTDETEQGKETYKRNWQQKQLVNALLPSMQFLESLDATHNS